MKYSKILEIKDGDGNHLQTIKISKARDYSDEYMLKWTLRRLPRILGYGKTN